MATGFDPILGMHATAMQLRAKRSEVLANNLVNADTPGFKAKDLNFKQALQQASLTQPQMNVSRTHSQHMNISTPSMDVSLIQREGLQASRDGNTVDAEMEKVLFTKNTLDYQFELNKVDSAIKRLRTAIKGE